MGGQESVTGVDDMKLSNNQKNVGEKSRRVVESMEATLVMSPPPPILNIASSLDLFPLSKIADSDPAVAPLPSLALTVSDQIFSDWHLSGKRLFTTSP